MSCELRGRAQSWMSQSERTQVPRVGGFITNQRSAWQMGSLALVSMQNASSDGLGQMPAMEPSIASLIVSPNESLSDASLQAFALMTRELIRLMLTLTLTRCQVWSPLPKLGRRAQGKLFGPAAQQAFERGIQANQTRQQFVSLQGPTPLLTQ
ncbi:uncharacterized protein AKAME5_000761800 [Lates japonicus]|uniref:Uncharacterized protein n=1 Tax=Lates japonicus TaxID=270547 RepID=A0AAD3MJ31_LATJO|nr:uncharacterized protein AKAME5_000761800 [Lates japonicus]